MKGLREFDEEFKEEEGLKLLPLGMDSRAGSENWSPGALVPDADSLSVYKDCSPSSSSSNSYGDWEGDCSV